MIYKLKHNLDANYTHQPVLEKLLSITTGPILELGCGEGSTELIHQYSLLHNRKTVSVESSEIWLEKYKEKYTNQNHEFIHTNNWEDVNTKLSVLKWGLVFIDQGSWEARADSFNTFKNISEYLILHDCYYFPKNKLIGKEIEPLLNKENTGIRDWSDDIKYSKEYFPKEFMYITGPPTLVCSQFNDCNFDVDFTKFEIVIN